MSSLIKLVNNGEFLDLTEKITVPSYKVNTRTQFTEWTDGDLILHRDIQRQYLEGSFTLLFIDKDDYISFLDFYNEALTDGGYIQAYVYSNNKHEVVLTNIFMDFDEELANEMPFMGIKEIDGIEVKIREK
jgi:hypothetical protein